MMLQRRRSFGSNLFDEVLSNPFFNGIDNEVMKTDVKEKDGSYVLDMDLPGFNKEDIRMELEDGYLTISASKNQCNEDKDENGNYVFQERFTGQCSRSFYIGDNVKESDIRAAYRNGLLRVVFPKLASNINGHKRYIQID